MPMTPDVSRLSDHQLLAGAKELARRERHLNLRIIEHLSEIGRRGLHLRHGYGSLFDYAVKELGFAEGSAYQRLQTLKLSNAFPEVKRDLRNGGLTLTAAGYLQSLFDRDQRRQRQWAREQRQSGAPHLRDAHGAGGTPGAKGSLAPAGSHRADGPAGAGGGEGAAGAVQPSAAWKTLAAEYGTAPLSAAAKRELIARARGKSTRQVRELIAEFDPELARPRDRLRAVGRERWELKAVIGAECRRGLEQLRHWLSHVNPAMDYGELLQRVVADAVRKYDPARAPASRGRQASYTGAPVDGAGSHDRKPGATTGGPGGAETGQISVPDGGDETAAAAATLAGRRRTVQRDRCNRVTPTGGRMTGTASQPSASLKRSPVASAARTTNAEPRSPVESAASARKCGDRRGRRGAPGCHDSPTSAQKRSGPAAAGGRGAPGRHDSPTSAQKRSGPAAAGGRGAPGCHDSPASAQKRSGRAAADGRGAAGRLPGATTTRAIPAAVRRHIWLRDRGRCTYRDPESGRCCGSRHLVQIDHIQPYAMGGSACVENLRLLCSAHNRARAPKRKGRSG